MFLAIDSRRAGGSAGGHRGGLAGAWSGPAVPVVRSIGWRPSSARRRRPGHSRAALARSLGDDRPRGRLLDPARGALRRPRRAAPFEPPSAGGGRATTSDHARRRAGGPSYSTIARSTTVTRSRARSAPAARLAVDNERLRAQVFAQLADLRAARARIVTAGDDERTPARARPPRWRAAAAARTVVRPAGGRPGEANSEHTALYLRAAEASARACGAARNRVWHPSRDPRQTLVSSRHWRRSATPAPLPLDVAQVPDGRFPRGSRPRPTWP